MPSLPMSHTDPDKCPRCGNPLPLDTPRVCVRCSLIGAQEIHTEESELEPLEQQIEEVVYYEPGEYIDDKYKVVRRLGKGGFAVVYLVEQQEPFQRKVALKIMKRAVDTEFTIDRFKTEIQSLAKLNHSSIAKVFDAGVTKEELPYFTMELIDGVKITKYCDEKQLKPNQRLELFVNVCEAAYYAHLNGIIHRDITPSNILVTQQSNRPLPKVIDFGIAKTMTGSPQGGKELTVTHEESVGTRPYMSPEETGLLRLEIDSRTDVYSLGVVLYQLLVTRLPIEPHGFSKDSFLQRILNEKPLSPSAKFKSLGDLDRLNITHARQIDPSDLQQLLPGELDRIVMKCLEKDREQRYDTAHSVAKDIQHYLKGEKLQETTLPKPKRDISMAIIGGLFALIVGFFIFWKIYDQSQSKAGDNQRQATVTPSAIPSAVTPAITSIAAATNASAATAADPIAVASPITPSATPESLTVEDISMPDAMIIITINTLNANRAP